MATPDTAATRLPGWHHFTRDNRAHYLTTTGYALCQLSDVGEPIDRGEFDQVIGRICGDCRAVYKARVGMALRKAATVTNGSGEVE